MTDTLLFFITCLVTIFSVLDPFGAAVTLLAMTPDDPDEHRRRQAKRAVRAAFAALLVFTFVGGWIFTFFGISLHALMVAGGLILVQVAFRMLDGRALAHLSPRPEQEEAEAKDDIAIIPMAIPVLAGPAMITTVTVFANRANGLRDWVALIGALTVAMLLTNVILQQSRKIADMLGQTGLRVLTRAMGLILISMGVEFVLSGVKKYFGLG